jgi:MYXO-CTERM domain-containing protein
MRWLFFFGVAALAMGAPRFASARDFRVNDIPNGNRFRCLNCHTDDSGKSFTPFGSDAKSHLVTNGGAVSTEHVLWDSKWCQRDSDGDGVTNGAELGDPNCTWKSGQASPSGAVTNPGTTGDGSACGNGTLDQGEECDGEETLAFACEEVNLGTGLLGCTQECVYDTTACSHPTPIAPEPIDEGGCGFSASSAPMGLDGFAVAALGVGMALRRRRKA